MPDTIVHVLLILGYAFWPGDPSGLLPGRPWQTAGGAVITAVLAGVLVTSAFPVKRRLRVWTTFLLAVLIGGRVILGGYLLREGWSSSFFVLHQNALRAVPRIGARTADGGVLDRRIAVSERSSAFQFLNDDLLLSPGGLHPVDPVAMELRWHGYVVLDKAAPIRLQIESEGPTHVSVDGVAADTRTPGTAALSDGVHEISVTYVKAAGVRPGIAVEVESDSGAALAVFPERPIAGRLRIQSFLRGGLLVLDLLAICAFVMWVWPSATAMIAAIQSYRATRVADLARNTVLLIGIPLVAFAVHGLVAAGSHRDLTVFLIGDDMRQYAADGRNIAVHGLLMNQGRPLFTGQPFFFYPLYPYFVAATHLLFDESFYGVVFLQFVLLGATIAILAWLASDMFGRRVAWLSLAILCVLAEMDFVRYYTVSVYTDNLYYPLVAGAVAAMWTMHQKPGIRGAILAGVLGGLATLTRPSMMFVLPIFMIWLLRNRRERAATDRSKTILVFATAWMAAIGLATLRNWLVSGRFVLLAESSLQIIFFLAPAGVNPAAYMPNSKPSVIESLIAAVRIFRDHPYGVLVVEARKLAFMAGFTNLMPSFRVHPEFVALTGAYIGWWVQTGRRGAYGGPIHVALLGHVIAFLVASPMTYGYKTMLTLMMLIVPFAAAFLWTAGARFHSVDDESERWLFANQIR